MNKQSIFIGIFLFQIFFAFANEVQGMQSLGNESGNSISISEKGIFLENGNNEESITYNYRSSPYIQLKEIPQGFKIIVDWNKISSEGFQYFKISHSTTNPNITYPENWVWFSYDTNKTTVLFSEMEQYSPNTEGINYFRLNLVYENNDIILNENPIIIDYTNFNDILGDLGEIKTFLRNNNSALEYIEKNDFLKEKTTIKEFDKKILSEQLVNLDKKERENIEKIIKMISIDLEIKDNISKITTEIEIDNKIDLTQRSIDFIGSYKLNEENLKALNEKKIILKNIGNISQTGEIIQKNENHSNIERNISMSKNTSSKVDTNESVSKNINISDEITITDEISILYTKLLTVTIFLFLVVGFGMYKYFQRKKTKLSLPFVSKTIQILKNGEEYSIEYDGIYNKGVKVGESTKKSITESIDTFIASTNKLGISRGFLEKLEATNITVPDLTVSGNLLYKLFIHDNIKQKLNTQNVPLIIKTDEQEIPWEIIHDSQQFLSLKFPICRQIMTREIMKKNTPIKTKIPKILFIVNPTSDLPGTEKETNAIIEKLGKTAKIHILAGKDANLMQVITELSKKDYHIIHYSGHAYFDNKKPDESGLLLYENQVLANSEIKRLLDGNPLIFLNACSSGKSLSDDEGYYQAIGEDTLGLATSFVIGGAKGVISTLWPIQDQSASFFAIQFYMKFLGNENIGNALLYAKKETYLKNKKDPTWASFIYYGEPNLTINT